MKHVVTSGALILLVACVTSVTLIGLAPGVLGAGATADVVLLNGKVVTVDSQNAIAQAVAIQGGRILAVGSTAAVRAYAGPSTRVIDLHGRTVLPGLIDSHIHAIRQGLTWNHEVHWGDVPTLAQAIQLLKARAAATPPGGWVVVAGGWHERQFTEKRLPTVQDLDAAVPDHPVWVQRLYERVILNHAGISALGLTAATPNPPGGAVPKDGSGQPTGILTGFGGINAYYGKIPRLSLDGQIADTRDWFKELNRVGLTAIGDVAGGGLIWPAGYRAVTALHDRGQLTVRVRWYMQPNRPGHEIEVIQQFVDTVRPGAGDEWLKPIGVGEQVLASSYDGDAFGPLPPQFTPQAVADWERAARIIIQSGWRMQVHATRSHSAEQLLPALEAINASTPVGPRRIAFAHMEDVTPQTARRIHALGGGITVQDRLVFSAGDIMANWPADVYRQAPPIRTLLAMGVPVGGGTDATRVAPYNPFISLWWMVTGKTIDGVAVRSAAASPTRLEALRIYTLGSAWFNLNEERQGSIEPGKDADLVVLSGDYLTVPVDQIKSLVSVLTIVGGRPVYSAGDYAAVAR